MLHPLSDNIKVLLIVEELYVLHDVFILVAFHFSQLFEQADVWDLARHCSFILFEGHFYCNMIACVLMHCFHNTTLLGVLAKDIVLS